MLSFGVIKNNNSNNFSKPNIVLLKSWQ